MKKLRVSHLVIIFLLVLALTLLNPFHLDFNQSMLFSAMVFTVGLWATNAVHKSIACIFFLLISIVFGRTPALDIVGFIWSDTSLLIITTTLLSVGIMKTGLVQKYVEKLLKKKCFKYFYALTLALYLWNCLSIYNSPGLC